jgi:hypothetical protein
MRLVVAAAYLINTSPKNNASFTLNGAGAGFAAAASYGSPTKFNFTMPAVNAPTSPPTILSPGSNIIEVWGQTYKFTLCAIPNTEEELRLFFFSNQLIIVDSFVGVILVVMPQGET